MTGYQRDAARSASATAPSAAAARPTCARPSRCPTSSAGGAEDASRSARCSTPCRPTSRRRDHAPRPADGDAGVRHPAHAARAPAGGHRGHARRLDPPPGVRAELAGLPVLAAEANDRGARRLAAGCALARRPARRVRSCCSSRSAARRARARPARADRAGHRLVGARALRAADPAQPDVGDARRAGDRDLDRVQRAALRALPRRSARAGHEPAEALARTYRSTGAAVLASGVTAIAGLRGARRLGHPDAARLRLRDGRRPHRLAARRAGRAARGARCSPSAGTGACRGQARAALRAAVPPWRAVSRTAEERARARPARFEGATTPRRDPGPPEPARRPAPPPRGPARAATAGSSASSSSCWSTSRSTLCATEGPVARRPDDRPLPPFAAPLADRPRGRRQRRDAAPQGPRQARPRARSAGRDPQHLPAGRAGAGRAGRSSPTRRPLPAQLDAAGAGARASSPACSSPRSPSGATATCAARPPRGWRFPVGYDRDGGWPTSSAWRAARRSRSPARGGSSGDRPWALGARARPVRRAASRGRAGAGGDERAGARGWVAGDWPRSSRAGRCGSSRVEAAVGRARPPGCASACGAVRPLRGAQAVAMRREPVPGPTASSTATSGSTPTTTARRSRRRRSSACCTAASVLGTCSTTR